MLWVDGHNSSSFLPVKMSKATVCTLACPCLPVLHHIHQKIKHKSHQSENITRRAEDVMSKVHWHYDVWVKWASTTDSFANWLDSQPLDAWGIPLRWTCRRSCMGDPWWRRSRSCGEQSTAWGRLRMLQSLHAGSPPLHSSPHDQPFFFVLEPLWHNHRWKMFFNVQSEHQGNKQTGRIGIIKPTASTHQEHALHVHMAQLIQVNELTGTRPRINISSTHSETQNAHDHTQLTG